MLKHMRETKEEKNEEKSGNLKEETILITNLKNYHMNLSIIYN
jgi:hypothetical protein